MSSPAVNVNPRLAALLQAGVSPWLDLLRRSLIEGGELQRMIEEESLRGATSNPAIFEKAILGSDDYDDQLAELANSGADGRETYRAMVVRDVQAACDVFRPVWEQSDHADGYVSLEVEPDLANDTEGTITAARYYWERVDRPNVMIKIPGTPEGVQAIETATYEGINVNVTLLFAVDAYREIAEAYIRGMRRRKEEGKSLDVHSVASFFVSRVDTEVDKRLGDNDELKGLAGLANARAAYKLFLEDLKPQMEEIGCPLQRPLWASTGVKDPRYPDTLYVDGLVGPDTVNTMPLDTLLATGDHGEITGETAALDPTDDLKRLADAGIDLDDVTDQLLTEGIAKFVTPMIKLMAGIESKRESIVTRRPQTFDSNLPDDLEQAVRARIDRAVDEDVARRVWQKDPSLWGGDDATPELKDRLGWLTVAERLQEELQDLQHFASEVQGAGVTDVLLLGMGGSSLAPEVFRRSFGAGDLRLHVLDSTHPDAVREAESAIDLDHTLFIVSSKSGGTIETLSHFKHFFERTDGAGDRFVAITDPGSPLAQLAAEKGFRRVFEADPEIGGRYSALSHFGIVPAVLMGADVEALLDGALIAAEGCRPDDPGAHNSGLWLGATLGELALNGRDKLTFVVDDPEIASVGLWLEQLVAESTGKHGRGILPVADEPLGAPEQYGDDRVFVHLKGEGGKLEEQVQGLAHAGHAVLTIPTKGAKDLGRIFFFAEFATAVAGWALELNPFDQPNVQEAKDNTKKVLEGGGAGDITIGSLSDVTGDAEPPHYVAFMAYVPPSEKVDLALEALRRSVRDETKATTTFGYGPRFLHSTGQFHKGGPKTGLFVQLVGDVTEDVQVPDADFTFGTLIGAQADGDYATLQAHGLKVVRVPIAEVL